MAQTTRPIWVLCALLAAGMLAGITLLFVRLKPYWIAKYRGEEADLRGAILIWAPLRQANLEDANLRGADLRSADLRRANLEAANLEAADLTGADLRGAKLAF